MSLALSTLLLLGPTLSTTPTAQAEEPDPLARTVEAVMAEKRIPGVVVGIVRGEELVERRAFGLARLEGEQPMTPEHLFQIGSVTKPLTATLLALLIDEGLLDGGAQVEAWLPDDLELARNVGSRTVRELASHSAGLPREPVNRRDVPESPSVMEPYSVAELYEGLESTEIAGEIGSWSYSNLGYALLGHVLERAGGAPYETLLRERLLTPLGMTSTGIDVDADQEPRLAAHYWPEDAELRERPRWRFGEVAAFGGATSGVDDLARFVAAQYDPSEDALLSTTARTRLHQPLVAVDPAQGRLMSMGWFVSTLPGVGSVLGHGGEVDGHSACIAVLREARVGLIVLANLGGDAAETLCVALMQRVLPGLLAQSE
jgi:CubicO group peptidase (beta-lactamase class C family)